MARRAATHNGKGPGLAPALERLIAAWGKKPINVAQQFIAAVARAGECEWLAVVLAQQLRALFPRKADHGKRGWMDFCQQVLGRSARTIGARIRAAAYCDEYVPGWRDRLPELPPYYLVAELAAREPGPIRDALKEQLFQHEYLDTDDFRLALKDLALQENLDDGPPDPKRRNGARRENNSGAKKTSIELIPVADAAKLVTETFPDEVRIIPAKDDWKDIVDLGLDLSAKMTANAASLERNGGIVLIKPAKRGGVA